MTAPPASPPPTPTSITGNVANQVSGVFKAISILLEPPYVFMLIALIVVVFIAILIRLSMNAGTPPIFRVAYKNADAIFIIYRSKLNDVLILPARYHMQGLFMATYRGQVFLIITDPSIQPVRSSILWDKPIYFAYGDGPMVINLELESMMQSALLKISSDKSLTEVIAEVLQGSGKLTGKMPIGSSYKLYITIDARKVLQEKVISFFPDIATSLLQSIKVASDNAMEIAKMGIVSEKLKLRQSFGRNQLIITILMIAMMAGIIMFVLTTFKP